MREWSRVEESARDRLKVGQNPQHFRPVKMNDDGSTEYRVFFEGEDKGSIACIDSDEGRGMYIKSLSKEAFVPFKNRFFSVTKDGDQ